jgi:hypothetical protein
LPLSDKLTFVMYIILQSLVIFTHTLKLSNVMVTTLSLIRQEYDVTIFKAIEMFIEDETQRLLNATTDFERLLIKHRIADARMYEIKLRLAKL